MNNTVQQEAPPGIFTRKEIEVKVKETVNEYCSGVDKDEKPIEITPKVKLDNLLLDSLDIVEMIMGFEEFYDITITDEEGNNLQTVKDMINIIIQKLKNVKRLSNSDDTYITSIVLPDYSYLPENIDLSDQTFKSINSASDHINNQKEILQEWMKNDKSCNVPVSFKSHHINDKDVVYDVSFIAEPGNVECIFVVKKI